MLSYEHLIKGKNMTKLISSIAQLNEELKLPELDMDGEDIEENTLQEINELNNKYSGLIDKSLLGISQNKIKSDFSDHDFYIDYDLLINSDQRNKKESFNNYCDFIIGNIESGKLMGNEYLIKLDMHDKYGEIDNLTLISFIYLLSSLNKVSGDFVLKPILKIRRNEKDNRFTIFYFLDNYMTSQSDFESVCDLGTGADTALFKTIEHFKYIIINGHKYDIYGCSISDRMQSFKLLTE